MMKKIKGHESAQVRINEHNNGAKELISYSTTVIELTADGGITVNGLYSATTRKHIGWFMKNLGYTYQLAKQLVTDGMQYNIRTGEYRRAE